MTQVSPACARRMFPSAAGLVTPSHGSTPRATRSSKLNSPGSVLSNQMATQASLLVDCVSPEGTLCLVDPYLKETPGVAFVQTFSGVHDGGSLAGNDSWDSSVTRSPWAV